MPLSFRYRTEKNLNCILLISDKSNVDNMPKNCGAFLTGWTYYGRRVTSEAIEPLHSNPHKWLQIEKKFSHLHNWIDNNPTISLARVSLFFPFCFSEKNFTTMFYIYLNKHKNIGYDAGHSILLENVQFGRKLSLTNSPYWIVVWINSSLGKCKSKSYLSTTLLWPPLPVWG